MTDLKGFSKLNRKAMDREISRHYVEHGFNIHARINSRANARFYLWRMSKEEKQKAIIFDKNYNNNNAI
jgi:hypothetical protein